MRIKLSILALITLCGVAIAQPGRLSPQGGTITQVTAGNGLVGGGTSGAITLDVVCGTGLTCAGDSISISNSVITGSGTLNRLTKWTSGNTVGDSAFPIDDTTTQLTLGSAATDLFFLNAEGMVNPLGSTRPLFTGGINATWTIAHPGGDYGLGVIRAANDSGAAHFSCKKTRSTDPTSNVAILNGDTICDIVAQAGGVDTQMQEAARIQFRVDSAPGSSVVPTAIDFQTDDDGTPATRMSIGSLGNVTINAPESGTALAVSNNVTTSLSVTSSVTAGTNHVIVSPGGGTRTGADTMILTSSAATFDTTAASITSTGVNVSLSTSRSAGANDLINNGVTSSVSGGQNNRAGRFSVTGTGATNYAILATATSTGTGNTGLEASATGAGTVNTGVLAFASGAGTNNALQTTTGNVLLNATSGNTTIGSGATGSSTLNFNGLSSTFTTTPTASTSSNVMLTLTGNGTFDTTAGSLSETGISVNITATRSAGANIFNNTGITASASGAATNNFAYRSNSGDNALNVVDGETYVGYAAGSGPTTQKLGVLSAASSTAIGAANTSTGQSSHIGISSSLSGTVDATGGARTATGITSSVTASRSAGANNLTNVAGDFNSSGAQINIALQTSGGNNYLNTTAGALTGVGYASGVALPARFSVINTTAAAGSYVLTTVASTSSLTTLDVADNGTFDTTAGVLATNGINVSVTSTRSAGANDLTNRAGQFSASGAQVNIAIQTLSGSNYFNTSGNNSGFGYAAGATLPAKMSVIGGGDVVYTGFGQNALLTTWTPVASTAGNLSAIRGNANGTFDTTAGVLTSFAITAVNSSTRSAGASNLTNTGLFASATGAQVNIAIRTDDGSNYFNAASGNTGVGYAVGATLTSKFNVTGDITTTGVIHENGWTTLTQATDQVVTNAQNTASNTFTFSTASGSAYEIECHLVVSGENTANDFEFRGAVTAGTMTGGGMVQHPDAADAATTTFVTANAATTTNQVAVGTFTGNGIPRAIHFVYAFIQNTSAATFRLEFGNNVAAAGIDSTMEANSRCRYRLL